MHLIRPTSATMSASTSPIRWRVFLRSGLHSNASEMPSRMKATAVSGFIATSPGTILFSSSMFADQPKRTSTPTTIGIAAHTRAIARRTAERRGREISAAATGRSMV